MTGCFTFRAGLFAGVRLGFALATVRFAALDTLGALPRLAAFPLGSFPRFCTFARFLLLAMIDPPCRDFGNSSAEYISNCKSVSNRGALNADNK